MPKEVNIGEVKAEKVSASTEVGLPVEQEKVEEKAEEKPFYMDDKILNVLRAIQEKEFRSAEEGRFRQWSPPHQGGPEKYQSTFAISHESVTMMPRTYLNLDILRNIHLALDDLMKHMSSVGKYPDFETLNFSFQYRPQTMAYHGRWVISDKL